MIILLTIIAVGVWVTAIGVWKFLHGTREFAKWQQGVHKVN